MKKLFASVLVLFFITGCVTLKYSSTRQTEQIDNLDFAIVAGGNQWDDNIKRSFDLTVTNNNDYDVEINWDRTLYIDNGQTQGGFMFAGVNYANRNAPKAPDIIFAGQTFKKRIYPNIKAQYINHGWVNLHFNPGRYGALLSVWAKGQEKRVRLEVNIQQIQ